MSWNRRKPRAAPPRGLALGQPVRDAAAPPLTAQTGQGEAAGMQPLTRCQLGPRRHGCSGPSARDASVRPRSDRARQVASRLGPGSCAEPRPASQSALAHLLSRSARGLHGNRWLQASAWAVQLGLGNRVGVRPFTYSPSPRSACSPIALPDPVFPPFSTQHGPPGRG